MSRLTDRFGQNATTKEPCYIPAGMGTKDQVVLSEIVDKLGRLEDLEEAGNLLNTYQAAVILAEAFGYEHPCNFNGIDEWFPEVCVLGDLCSDGKMSAIACWEQYIKIKLAELKGGDE